MLRHSFTPQFDADVSMILWIFYHALMEKCFQLHRHASREFKDSTFSLSLGLLQQQAPEIIHFQYQDDTCESLKCPARGYSYCQRKSRWITCSLSCHLSVSEPSVHAPAPVLLLHSGSGVFTKSFLRQLDDGGTGE